MVAVFLIFEFEEILRSPVMKKAIVSKTEISRKIPKYFKFVKKMNLNVLSIPSLCNCKLHFLGHHLYFTNDFEMLLAV